MKIQLPASAVFYALPAAVRGMTLSFFVLMPAFYAEKLVKAQEMGLIGAMAIGMVIVGALVVARSLHNLSTKRLLSLGSGLAVLAAAFLLLGVLSKSLALIVVAYAVLGLTSGISKSGSNAVSASITSRGDRFGRLAKQSMVVDGVRIAFPLAVAGMVALMGVKGGAVLACISALLLCVSVLGLPVTVHAPTGSSINGIKWGILRNSAFRFVLSLEFLDSLASSELFVFLPLVLLAKGYNVESSLLLQSFLFLGYLTGRWLVGRLAKRYSGIHAIGLAEAGMVISIVLLLTLHPLWLLYLLSFMLGIFTRGTSPAIKALAFDSVKDHQTKQASAIHVVAGDSGSALAQLSFGFLVAWLGANAPFILSAAVAGVIAAMCFVARRSVPAPVPAELTQ